MNKKQISLIILLSVLCVMSSTYAKEVKPINTTSLVTNISSLKVPEATQIVGLGEASHGVSEYHSDRGKIIGK